MRRKRGYGRPIRGLGPNAGVPQEREMVIDGDDPAVQKPGELHRLHPGPAAHVEDERVPRRGLDH